ncbi:MAG TPA: multicopper oxidase domain-containing protein [Candidatus Baltobacteraceae bacterium]|nr:multicopper oxidase domain-containing protein [Candidatus Baltobacteraceae bacterium]
MSIRLLAHLAAAILLMAVASDKAAIGGTGTGVALHPSGACGRPIASGAFIEPPAVALDHMPLDDLGRHEFIMRVVRAGARFCFHYTLGGVEQNVAPTLVVHRGERFAVRLVNEISGPASGATMKASDLPRCAPAPMNAMQPHAFSGYLDHTIYSRYMEMQPLDVNLHLHGFEGPPQQENVFLSTLSTPAHACEYDITVPLTQPPGTYFYHPHAHGMTGVEVGGGLSGMWIVEPDASQLSAVDEHEVIMRPRRPGGPYDPVLAKAMQAKVDALAALGAVHEHDVKPAAPLTKYDPFNPPPWPSNVPVRAGSASLDLHGCGPFAEVMFTVNGVDNPARLTVRAGKPQLLRLLNALPNGTKLIRLRDASGAVQTMHVVARDGVPISSDDAHPFARYVATDGIMLGPTMRADVLLTLRAGETATLYSDRRCLGPFDGETTAHDLLTISAVPSAQSNPPEAVDSAPATQTDSRAALLLQYARAHPAFVRRRALTYTEYSMRNANGKGIHGEFFITETSNRNFHEQPYWPKFDSGQDAPAHADIVVKQGSIEEWYLFNATLTTHTFHIHQMAFAAEDEQPMPVMLDTVIVPAGRALPNPRDPDYPLIKPSVTRVLLDFRHVPRGEFVYHCHMLFHEDDGMMGVIRVM